MRARSKYVYPAPSAGNACDQVAIGFVFTSDWLSNKWREFFKPIIERSKAKPKQFRDYFRYSIKNRFIPLTVNLVLHRHCMPREFWL